MTLPNTRKLATVFVYGGVAFKLSPFISRMEALEEATGSDYFAFVDEIVGRFDSKTGAVVQKPNLDKLSILFFHLQDMPQTYSRDEIHEWLLSDMKSIGTEDVQKQLAALFFALKGVDYQDMITAVASKKETDESKPAAA